MSNVEFPGNFDINSPAVKVVAISPNDNVDLPTAVKALWVNSSGTVRGVPLLGNTAVTFAVIAGTPLPVAFKRIFATGTTAQILGIVK